MHCQLLQGYQQLHQVPAAMLVQDSLQRIATYTQVYKWTSLFAVEPNLFVLDVAVQPGVQKGHSEAA